MQTALIRSQFIEKPLDADDMQFVAVMLTDWFHQHYGQEALGAWTATLWGFAQSQGRETEQRLKSIAAEKNLSFDSIGLSAPNFLVIEGASVSSKPSESETEPLFAAIKAQTRAIADLLASGACENLWCELAFSFQGLGAKREAAIAVRRLVLSGVVWQNRFVMKALWPEGVGEFKSETYASAPWVPEADFLQSLTAYQNGNRAVPDWARTHLFFTTDSLPLRNAITWFLQPTPKSWRAVAGRIALFGTVASACGAVVFFYKPETRFLFVLNLLLTAAFLGCAYHLVMTVRRVAWTRRGMRANYEKLYSGQTFHVPIRLEDAPPSVQKDPALHKLSCDLEAIGGVHYQDVTIEPPFAGRFFIRLFLFPEAATLFALSFMTETATHRVFPAKPTFLVRTNFSDGFRLVTVNSVMGFRKNRLSHVICRRFMDASQPDEMLRKHLRALAKAEAEGHARLPLEPDTILEQMDAETREAGEISRKYGHMGWDDAFRMVFDMPRREYQEEV